MRKIFTLLLVGASALCVKAQAPAGPPLLQDFGKINKEDLEMKTCEFEKDANAMVLIDKGDLFYDSNFNLVQDYYKRIKIFNDNGKDQANIRIEFYGGNRSESVTGLQAETINLEDGKTVVTKLEKKLIYLQHIDKLRDAYVFSLPNVKPGSVIEYKYTWNSTRFYDIPDWFFQERIPVRYSELDTEIPEMLYFKKQARVRGPFFKHVESTVSRNMGSGQESTPYICGRELMAMANIHSLPDEPYMSSYADNLQCVTFQLTSARPLRGFVTAFTDTWPKIGGALEDDEDFGSQLNRKLNDEELIIAKAKALKTDDEKIAFLFNEVKNTMKWNDVDRWYTNDGTYRAWVNKSGNATEINLILYHLLKKSRINAYPMVVSTREHGMVNPYNPNITQFNRGVVYIPVDSTKRYVLDASGKFNCYNEIPANLLNSSGLWISKEKNTYDIVYLQKTVPVRQVVLINAEIKPDGKMFGTAQLNSFSYNRINALSRYKTDGEKKYTDYLRDDDNNLKISSIKFDNMEVDTLPLTQTIDFNLDLTGSDETYIYFSPNIFTSLYDNPFLKENRFTDIDFGYQNNYSINGIYKVPAGYKIDALPKNVSMSLPDKGITFKRIVAEQEGMIVVRYAIDYKKPIYFKENYADFHEFFKKMHEMLNEQIVLKKS